jgi:hypothetical protein
VIAELTRIPYMTVFAIVARIVTEIMAAGIVCIVAWIGQDLWGRRAGLWAAAVVALNSAFTYYAHTSNLDVPYLFWALLSYLLLIRAILRDEPAKLRGSALFAVFAIATKDQAYAAFLIAFPVASGLWLTLHGQANRKTAIARELAASTVLAALLLLLIDGALVNPTGFAARMRFLVGPASQNHTTYARSLAGVSMVLVDAARSFDRYYPWALAPLVLYGFVVHVVRVRDDRTRRVAGLVPALGIASFTIAFNCVARRTEHRFLLPQSLLVSLYAGNALDSLTRGAARVAAPAWALAAFIEGRALFDCAAVDAVLVRDPRYDAEAWLNSNVAPGEIVEVYGNNAYLPRLPRQARLQRVDTTPLSGRSPMPGMREIEAPFEAVEERRPDWIVVSEGWSWRYTMMPPESPNGSIVLSGAEAVLQRDLGARAFFAALFAGNAGYAEAHVARYDDHFWPRVAIHASTSRTVTILRRARR